MAAELFDDVDVDRQQPLEAVARLDCDLGAGLMPSAKKSEAKEVAESEGRTKSNGLVIRYSVSSDSALHVRNDIGGDLWQGRGSKLRRTQ